jgi:hypothetical protein
MSLGLEREVFIVPDMALMLPRVFPEARLREIRKTRSLPKITRGGNYMIVQGGIPREKIADMASILATLRKGSGLTIVLLPVRSWANDLESLRAVKEFAACDCELVNSYLCPEEIVALISGASRVMTNGLHSLVTAVAYGRNVTALPNTDPKISGFLRMLSLEDLQCSGWGDVKDSFGNDQIVSEIRIREASERGRTLLATHFDRIGDICVELLKRDV